MKDLALMILTGMVAGLLFTTGYFAIEASNGETKPAPYIKISPKSSQDRVERFFNNRTQAKVVVSQYFWRNTTNGAEETELEIFSQFNLTNSQQKQRLRLALGKQNYKRYLRTCEQLDAKDNSWTLGYCVDTPAKITDVEG